VIRRVHREAVEARGDGWVYLDTTSLVVDESGELLREVRVGGKVHLLRGEDGIHLTMSGSQYLADRVEPLVLNLAGVQPVQDGS
jgi:hypothetical protein